MKKRIYSQLMPCCKCFVIVLLSVLLASSVKAQIVAFYPLTSKKAITGNTNPGQAWTTYSSTVVTGTASVGTEITDNTTGDYNSQGIEMKTTGDAASEVWPSQPLTTGFNLNVPLSPQPGTDLHITGISFTDSTGGTKFNTTSTILVQPYYQVDGAGPWIQLGGAIGVNSSTSTSTRLVIPNVNDVFYSGHSYVVSFFFYSTNGATKEDAFEMDDVVFNGTVTSPPAGPITVTTNHPIATGKYTATATGSYSFGNQYYLATKSGIVYSTSSTNLTTALPTTTTDGANGVINDNLTGLNANTKYYVKAYAVTQFGTQYGLLDSFTTAPYSAPSVSINLTSILSNKAGVTGNVTDSGGLVISEKGFVWSTNGTPPTIQSNVGKQYEGSGTASFPDFIKGLKPNTPYCVAAYAINSVNVGYSNDTCFTTAAAVPTLTAIPGTIDFGQNFYQGQALILSYTLTGADLNGSQVTITPPAGFLISTTPTSASFSANPITITYTGSTLNPTPIYVEMPTSSYGNFAGNIIQSGGGTIAVNADMVGLTGSVVQSPIDVSNSGSDFLFGFGYEEKMSEPAGNADECKLSVYVTTGPQPATVHIVLNSGGYTQTQTIPANSYYAFTNFPTGDPASATNPGNLPDARLFSTGISNKSIHVYTDNNVPVSVFMHSYTDKNTAAGAMIFPTNTWNSSYTVQAFGGTSNNSDPNSFFFVIADEDNTVVTFTPTQPVLDASAASLFNQNLTTAANTAYTPGSTYTVTLNAGQVFNAMGGFNPAGNGLDLSGSKVSTTCDKKITVFGGNGRCLVDGLTCNSNTGSDHLIQQMFPSVAWGTKYLTVPTSGAELDYFRIYFQDPTTVVKVNGTTLLASTIKNGIYYEYQTAAPAEITSDKPINVSQFMLTPGCTTENGAGGPEMIILSPVEQAITSAVLYTPTSGDRILTGGGTGYTDYINVIIPTSKKGTFKLDGVTPPATGFTVHPQDATYSYGSFLVAAQAQHTIKADTGFVAIAYGIGDGESFGYNAGTDVKNLTSVQFTSNPNGGDSSATAVRTCVNNTVTLKIALPYLPSQVDSIVWNPQGNPTITPNNSIAGPLNAGKAKYDDTITVNGRTFYVYSSPVQYTFSQLGNYRFPVTAYGTFASDCPGQDVENMLVIVGKDQDNLTFTSNCGNPVVNIFSDTIPAAGTNILKWTWNFGDGSAPISGGNLADTVHKFPPGGSIYSVKLTTINSVGCVSTDSIQVDFSGGLKAAYTSSSNTVCSGSSITFTDNTTATGNSGTPNKWIWNFGDGSNLDSTTVTTAGGSISHPFTTGGKYAVTLTVKTSTGCVDIYIDSVTIQGTPIAAFTATSACLGSFNTFTNTSSVPNNLGTIDSSFWNYGDGVTDTTLGLQSATHQYAIAGDYITTLYVKSDAGCISAPATPQKDTAFALPIAGFKDSVDCANLLVYYTDTSNANGGTITEWDWDLNGDGTIDTVTHTAGIIFKHPYPNGNGQTFKPTLTVKTLAGCGNTTPIGTGFTIGVAPVPSFVIDSNTSTFCMPAASVAFSNTSTISDGSQMSYTWHFADGSPTADSNVAASAPGTAIHTFTGAQTYNVSITAKSNLGCIATSATQPVTVHALPVVAIKPFQVYDCLNDSLAFSSNATSTGGIVVNGWSWKFGDNIGTDARQNPQYEWKNPGQYNVSLVETSTNGCMSNPDTVQIRVDTLPVAGFTLYNVDCSKQIVTVVDTSNAHGGTIAQWSWDFGDNTAPVITTIPGDTVKHTYVNGNGNTYIINLTVTTKDNCINSAIPQIFTIGASPQPSFQPVTLTGLCLPNASETFTNTSKISPGDADSLSFIWHFGDGTPDSVINVGKPAVPPTSVTHIYTTDAPDTVILTAISNQGCTSTNFIILNNIHPQPVAVITAPAAVCLFDSAQLAGPNANNAAAWTWDFGDNKGTSTLQAPKYAWNNAGRYRITLVDTSSFGCPSAPAYYSITVNALPVAAFTFSDTTCVKNVVDFTDASTPAGLVNNWSWKFGDGGTDLVDQNPTYTYAVAGPYTVTLHVTDKNGCSDKTDATSPITINPLPQPAVSVLPICLTGSSANVYLTASNTGSATINNATGWTWLFDNDSTANGMQATYYYTHNGPQKSIQLNAISTAGCKDSITFIDTVYSTPVAQDSILNDTLLCSNVPVTLINESSVPGIAGYGSISKIEIYWNYTSSSTTPDISDNAPTSGKQYTNKLYPALASDATYTIRLNAYSGNGCPAAPADSIITVHGSPSVVFGPIAPICLNVGEFALTTGSQVSNLPGSGSYSGLGVVSDSAFNPQSAGSFPITYTYTTTPYGCSASALDTIIVYPLPVIDYGPTVSVLLGDSITLSPTQATSGLSYIWSPNIYLNTNTSATPVCKPADSVTYTITVQSPGGCGTSTTLFVQVLQDFTVPNTFTPNNDGINDKWVIPELPKFPIQWVQVFDRYGQLLYESHGYSTPWDGTYKGKPLPAGTYYYIIELNGVVAPKTGYVTILR